MKEIIPDKSKLHPRGSIEKGHKRMQSDLMSYWDKNERGLDQDKVEAVSCSLCKQAPPKHTEVLFFKYRFPYIRCPYCGLIYPWFRPNREYLDAQYVNKRFAAFWQEIYLPSAEYRMATIFRERVEEIIMPRVPSGRLLDVGCGSGHFLKVAQGRGFQVYGIEPNPEMAEFAERELGLPNIKQGVLEGDEYPLEYFDAITLWDVLEHVPDPGGLLRAASGLLKNNGWIFAYTENFDSFNVFITEADSEIFAPDTHVRHYTPETFKKEFEKAGFTVNEIMTKGLDIQHIESTVKINPEKYAHLDLGYLLSSQNELQVFINACGKGDNLRLFARKET